ncbi:probable G-protein coupled receptor B0563.6 [Mytilus trossulus]|uniref:probable G-protein coupled receptor B0563.6 n=1 Tax=Mytilus trossulus TaxID=6551 RepID=UPI0030061D6B
MFTHTLILVLLSAQLTATTNNTSDQSDIVRYGQESSTNGFQHGSKVTVADIINFTSILNVTSNSPDKNMHEVKHSNEDSLKNTLKQIDYIQNVYILPPVCSVGLVGNSLVALVLFEQSRTNSSFVYMLALIVSDIISLISDMLASLSLILQQFVSEASEKILIQVRYWNLIFVSYIFRCTAINILCVLSVERFIAIKYPFHLKSSITVKYPMIFLFISLFLAVLTNIPKVINIKFAEIKVEGTNDTAFKPIWTQFYMQNEEQAGTIILISKILTGPVPIVLFCVMNGLILHGIYLNKRMLSALGASNVSRNRSIKNVQIKLCKIFLVLCLTNILAFLPNSLIIFIGRLFPDSGLNNVSSETSRFFMHAGNILRVLNSASDFIVLIAMSSDINDAVKKKFICISTQFRNTEDTASTLKFQSSRVE